ncbi:MAG: hypothetical protein ACPG7F_01715 [Aggregatilineales bacterium]
MNTSNNQKSINEFLGYKYGYDPRQNVLTVFGDVQPSDKKYVADVSHAERSSKIKVNQAINAMFVTFDQWVDLHESARDVIHSIRGGRLIDQFIAGLAQ